MRCRLFLVRHGETEWNALTKFQGHTDVPLSRRGKLQAKLLGQRLAQEKITAFYASDLSRAFETASIISQYHGNGIEIEKVADLREINFGMWEGLTTKEIRSNFTKEMELWWKNPLNARIPGGETLAEVVERSRRAIKEIIRRHAGGKIVVVSHGGVIRCIVGDILGMDLNQYWRLKLDNASLTILEFSSWEDGIICLFNDSSHLKFLPYIESKFLF